VRLSLHRLSIVGQPRSVHRGHGRQEGGRGTKAKAPAADGALPTTRLDSLSVREIEVLRLIGKGLSRTQIAAELFRAAKTIDGHQERILTKLGVATRADLIRLAIREGFAEA